ncbi:hypothetical protein GYMLUDRAFT_252180 [Collybiopsis luxurians FD-317 M1]|uniref:TPX2 C-terminal domain-containing protein n=1 Tax=Collybiopsis luxurians FD-317 M1 TaxID=944289 RepID=A0A0D0BAL2_9AGAR|nr:hypothetical protein GYMLUDRAFT_252180 [Collybiopsis luxurians FD-317 M1]
MQNSSSNELSLRHLPDTSNASFSFEIPSGSNQDLLLNDDDDFFGAADDSFATPAPSRTIHGPLTIQPPTHKSAVQNQRINPSNLHSGLPAKKSLSVLANSSQANSGRITELEKASYNPKTINGIGGVLTRDEIMSTPRRLQRLRDEIESLAEPTDATIAAGPSITSDVVERNTLKSEFTASSGSIPKPTIGIPPSAPRPLHSSDSDPTLGIHMLSPNSSGVAAEKGDIDIGVFLTAGSGLASRLVMYSENLSSSHALPNIPGNPISSALTDSMATQALYDDHPNASISANDLPLTLSQLSPSKEDHVSPTFNSKRSAPSHKPASPVRGAMKRVGSPASNTQPRKKGKLTVAGSSAGPILPGTRNVIKKRRLSPANSSSASTQVKTKVVRHARPTRGATRTLKRSPGDLGTSSCSDQVHSPELSTGSLANSGQSSKLAMERSGGSSKASSTYLTRATEFNFRSDKRIEARKLTSSAREGEEQTKRKQKLHTPYSLPNFGASHAAQDALLTSIKDQITPVVPLPVELHTDARARERSRFNDRIREKELEAERALEERKRQRAEEEEKEMKELRKKAIPKAHPVPEWYKDAPKRKASRRLLRNEDTC